MTLRIQGEGKENSKFLKLKRAVCTGWEVLTGCPAFGAGDIVGRKLIVTN